MKFDIWVFSKICRENASFIKIWKNGYFTWIPVNIFLSYFTQFFLEREIFQKKFIEKVTAHISCSKTGGFFPLENLAVYEIMWRYIVVPDRPHRTIWRMRITCWIPEATNTHSEYVILIAFPLQRWLHERALMLRYAYITGLICNRHCSNIWEFCHYESIQPLVVTSKVRCSSVTFEVSILRSALFCKFIQCTVVIPSVPSSRRAQISFTSRQKTEITYIHINDSKNATLSLSTSRRHTKEVEV
jgi:hypothetical protein